ncbi:MAG: putative oxidoreductase [Chlamydiae bacterium]|nr:putative oxidoreductase [Chlamydiota bacterium]
MGLSTPTNKLQLPAIGLGTYHLQKESLQKMVEQGYQIGYRHFDTANYYQNEEELGQVLKKLPRGDFQISSKVWYDNMGYHNVLSSFERSINKLQLDSIDNFLIHWPHPHDLIMESLEALKDLKKNGRLKHYGVSNFTVHHLQDALDAGFEIDINQVEYHPYLNQEDLLTFCNHNNIKIVAYCPIARAKVMHDPAIQKIASSYDKSPIQIVLRWHIQKGIHPIPKTQHLDRLSENFDVFDFNLSDQEMVQINGLNKNERLIDQAWSHFDY